MLPSAPINEDIITTDLWFPFCHLRCTLMKMFSDSCTYLKMLSFPSFNNIKHIDSSVVWMKYIISYALKEKLTIKKYINLIIGVYNVSWYCQIKQFLKQLQVVCHWILFEHLGYQLLHKRQSVSQTRESDSHFWTNTRFFRSLKRYLYCTILITQNHVFDRVTGTLGRRTGLINK